MHYFATIIRNINDLKQGGGKDLKTLRIVVIIAAIFGLISCASKPSAVKQPAPDYSRQTGEVKRTLRLSSLDDAMAYLGKSLAEELAPSDGGKRFSARTADEPGEKALSPEENARQNAKEAMDELDREIAGQEGGGEASVSSHEEYSKQRSKNLTSGTGSTERPVVVAVTDFVTVEGKVTKLGRLVADKLTPYIAHSKKFTVMERALIDRVLDEQQFQVSAFVDENSTVEFGKLLGAETIITGSISGLDDVFYITAKAVDVARGSLLTFADVEISRSHRLATLYHEDLPHLNRPKIKTRVFRAQGLGVPSSKVQNQTQARALAFRAAKGDAMRNLVEEIKGTQITSDTTIQDMMTQDDNIRVQLNTTLRGARIVNRRELPDGSVEVEMEVELPEDLIQQLYSQ